MPRQKIYHGLFYGNHHDAVKRLSADTNVRINVPDGNFGSSSSYVSLEGPAEGVFRLVEIRCYHRIRIPIFAIIHH